MLDTSHIAETTATPNAANLTTEAELLGRAKSAIHAGESSLRDAAEALGLAQQDFNTTQREMAAAIGRSASWVNRLLKWRQLRYKECSPFGPTTSAARVSHAKPARASKPRRSKPSSVDTATSTGADAVNCAPTDGQTSAPTADQTSPSRQPSAAEAKGNLIYAIKHWWPYMDDAGKVEVTAFFFKQKGVRVS
jgi:hypothetical protein